MTNLLHNVTGMRSTAPKKLLFFNIFNFNFHFKSVTLTLLRYSFITTALPLSRLTAFKIVRDPLLCSLLAQTNQIISKLWETARQRMPAPMPTRSQA